MDTLNTISVLCDADQCMKQPRYLMVMFRELFTLQDCIDAYNAMN